MRLRRSMTCLLVATVLVGVSLSVSATAPAVEGKSSAKTASKTDNGPIDLNTATEAELTAVRGIGKVLAKRIVDFREKHGPFRRVEDLLKVQGIGEKSFEKLRSKLTVGSDR